MKIRITIDKVVEIKGLHEPDEIEDDYDEQMHDLAEGVAVAILCNYLADQSKETLIEWMDFNDSPLHLDGVEGETPDITLYPDDEEVPVGSGEWSTYHRD